MRGKEHLLAWTCVVVLWLVVEGNHYQWWTCSAECRRCVRRTTPLERWISEYYSGLFSREPPVAFYDSGTITDIGGNPDNPGNSSGGSNSSGQGNPGHSTGGSMSSGGNSHQYGCCETEFGHWAPNDTEFRGMRYTVVHLKQEYQFIPVGRCRMGTTCQQGTCVQILRAHWILVYNNTKPLTGAPVSFVPIKIPSHCECLNIGRARP